MAHLINLALGFLVAQFIWFPNLILPFFYGLPKAAYHSSKGTLLPATIKRYLREFGIWVFASMGIIAFLSYLLTGLGIFELDVFETGGAMSVLLAVGVAMSKKGRATLGINFWEYNLDYRSNGPVFDEYATRALSQYLDCLPQGASPPDSAVK